MPIRWNPVLVKDAADMIEGYAKQAAEPLEQARIVAQEAMKIENLPQYVSQGFSTLLSEISRAIGGSQWYPEGRLSSTLARIRESIPKGDMERAQQKQSQGETKPLM